MWQFAQVPRHLRSVKELYACHDALLCYVKGNTNADKRASEMMSSVKNPASATSKEAVVATTAYPFGPLGQNTNRMNTLVQLN